MAVPFAHLHIHTHYSTLDGIVLVDKMLGRAKELGQTAMAITDHGVMYGAVDFFTAAWRAICAAMRLCGIPLPEKIGNF